MITKALNTESKVLDMPPFKVLSNQYNSPTLRFTPTGRPLLGWANIQDLKQPLYKSEFLTFELSFPFKDIMSYTIHSAEKGFTRQYIIDEIRRAYRHLFRHSNVPAARWEFSGNSESNKQIHVFYPHSHLYVEQILINEKENSLEIKVDGLPKPNHDFDLPF